MKRKVDRECGDSGVIQYGIFVVSDVHRQGYCISSNR